jgi:Zinc finger, C3HC4 type (RING finger)
LLGTDKEFSSLSTPTVDAPGLHEVGANHIPPSTSSVPSAPPLDSLSSESFFSETHFDDNFGTNRLKSSNFEEYDNNCVNLGLCSICIEKGVEGACIPCGHMAGCMRCLQKIKETGGECPICRAKIVWIVKLYTV